MTKFSIIAIVYNCEEYIKKCLDSVFNQTYQDFELIVVNDGSMDNSLEIINSFSDGRMRVISQENRGVGGARNTGIREAKGEYIVFLDGDDYLEENALFEISRIVSTKPYDVVIYDAYLVNATNKNEFQKTVMGMPKSFNGNVLINKDNMPLLFQLAPASWNKALRRGFLQKAGFFFPEKMCYEDTLMTRQILSSANSIYVINKPLYCYFQRSGSIMNRKPSWDIVYMSNLLVDYFKDKELFGYCRLTLEAMAVCNIALMYIENCYRYDNKESDETKKAKAIIKERYSEWRTNPFLVKDDYKKIDTILNHSYSYYRWKYRIYNEVSTKIITGIKTLLKQIIGKPYYILRNGGLSAFITAVLFKIPFLRKVYEYGGSFTPGADILRHKIEYTLCKAVINNRELPEDFPIYKVSGKSSTGNEILVTPHTNDFERSYLLIIDSDGKLIKYKKINGFGYAFRKFRLKSGENFYAYLQTEGRFNHCYDNTRLTILDQNLEKTIDCVSMLKQGSIDTDGYCCDNHEYVILGKKHYILTCVKKTVVSDIPGYEGKEIGIIDSIIQEQNEGKVIFQFELSKHPELFSAALLPEDYSEYINAYSNDLYADCGHLNSVDIDPETGDLLLSYRSIGLVKIDHNDGHVIWVMGRNRCDIKGVPIDMLCLYQHDARYRKDGSITVFDNYGSPKRKSRILRYWIDETSLTLEKYKEYETNVRLSEYMGGAQLIDEESEIFEIAYGGALPYIGFEEYDFKNRKQNMKLIFKDGYDLYQVSFGQIEVCSE